MPPETISLTQTFVGQIYHFNVGIDVSRNVCVKDIVSGAYMVLQNYQNFIEITSNMIYIVAFGVGIKCPHKILYKSIRFHL